MFDSAQIDLMVRQNQAALEELLTLREVLGERFHGMEGPIDCLLLAVASGEPMILIGEPGTAKSMLIRSFAELIGIGGRDGADSGLGLYFDYLLTQFTEPSELFGYLNLTALTQSGEMRRDDAGMMQHAQVVFLDEVFNASSAILNALLTFMNERKFHDRGRVLDVRMQNLFAASNAPPHDPTLAAMFDRFVLRCTVSQAHATPEDLVGLVESGWRATFDRITKDPAREGLLDRMRTLQASIGRASRSGNLSIDTTSRAFVALAYSVRQVRVSGLSLMSNRRVVKFTRLMLIRRMLGVVAGEGMSAIHPADLEILIDFGLDRVDSSAMELIRGELHNMM